MEEFNADAQMQLERSSLSGNLIDQMELEASHPSHDDADPASMTAPAEFDADALALNKGLGFTASDLAAASGSAQDFDMLEDGDDADTKIDDIQDSLRSDAEMNAEMVEQIHLSEERDWKDVDAEVDVEIVPALEREGAGAADTKDITTTDLNSAGLDSDQQALARSQGHEDLGLEQGQTTLEDSLLPQVQTVAGSSAGTAKHQSQQAEGVQDEDETYADAPESHDTKTRVATTSALAPDSPNRASATIVSELRRPVLQKDFLAHVDILHGQPSSNLSRPSSSANPEATEFNERFTPHVSLISNNLEYSLFRPSSEPSGDDENILFGLKEQALSSAIISAKTTEPDAPAHGSQKDDLYFASLESFIAALHSTFPDLKGDGDNELILDFGMLDLQISEDNVYCQQLSLYDFDRIRVGMCQPELDRLQLTLKTGKRFAYRFNELAEHCYRMFAGSDDSGTIYDETADDPLPADFLEEAEGDYDEVAEDTINSAAAVSDNSGEAGADYITGENVEDLDDSALAQNEHEAAVAEAEVAGAGDSSAAPGTELAGVTPTLSVPPRNESEVAIGSSSSSASGPLENPYIVSGSSQDEQGDVHPPSDEYYEDPEFSQEQDDVEVDAVESYEEDDDDATIQALDVVSGEEGQEEEEGRTLDPEASLEEAALQAEELEETAFDEAQAAEEEGDAHASGDMEAGSDRKVDVDGNEDASNYYQPLMSPTNEEVVLLEQPDSSLASTETEISKATLIDEGNGPHSVEEATQPDTRVLSSSKRRRDSVDDDGYDSIYDNDYSVVDAGRPAATMGNGEEVDAKRPKLATE